MMVLNLMLELHVVDVLSKTVRDNVVDHACVCITLHFWRCEWYPLYISQVQYDVKDILWTLKQYHKFSLSLCIDEIYLIELCDFVGCFSLVDGRDTCPRFSATCPSSDSHPCLLYFSWQVSIIGFCILPTNYIHETEYDFILEEATVSSLCWQSNLLIERAQLCMVTSEK